MSITLFCLFKGNTTASAFSVEISRNEPVSKLKEAIKAKKAPEFNDYSADKFKLWKVKIASDHDDQLRNLSLKGDEELSAINDIGDYWPEKPPKKNVHVIVEPPSKQPEWVTSFAESYKQFVYDFDVVVSPKQKAYKWTASTQMTTLEDFKDSIRGMYHPPALEYDGMVLNFMDGGGRYSPRDDLSFRKMLQSLVSKSNFKLTVIIEISKPFNEWTFPEVCELYGLSDDLNPSIDVYPNFSCGCADLKDEKSQSVVKHLMAELETTPLDVAHEATKSIYSYCYLACGVSFYEKNFRIIPGKHITGHNGQGNLDYAIECRSTNRIVGLVEVKKDNFKQGFAQTTVQMESSLTCRKRKLNEIENSSGLDKVWGIVTDAEKWYFMEYRLDSEGKPTFKLSEPVIVLYKDENLQAKVEKVLGHIVWLLEETQKSLDDSRGGEQSRVIKKHRSSKKHKSSSNLTEKSDTVDRS